MGRTYAGVLGPLALVVVVVRCLRYGSGAESTMFGASLCLVGFAGIGYLAGRLAQWIVDESVRSRVEAELAARAGGMDQQRQRPAATTTAQI